MKYDDLVRRMIKYASDHDLVEQHPMRLAAAALGNAAAGYAAKPPTVSPRAMMGAWGHAQRVWCDYSGEPIA